MSLFILGISANEKSITTYSINESQLLWSNRYAIYSVVDSQKTDVLNVIELTKKKLMN